MNLSDRTPKRKCLYGISFDAVAVSGVLVEFYKVAEVFHNSGYEVYLDLGYDIVPRKGNFLKPYNSECHAMPSWVQLARMQDVQEIEDYTDNFIQRQRLNACASEGNEQPKALDLSTGAIRSQLTDCIVRTWEARQVDFVIVENGTLPENVIFTAALYDAIQHYGSAHGLGKFVLWRDHDLMWSSEASSKKYGSAPYFAVPKPRRSPFIQYVVQHEYNRRKMQDWSAIDDVSILRNRFHFHTTMPAGRSTVRERLGIPSDALVVGRLTRIIPQKRIDNELQILVRMKELEKSRNLPNRAFLAVAGNPGEDVQEFARLRNLVKDLNIEENVVFTGPLVPDSCIANTRNNLTTRDLLAEATLSSFLTSYDYDSFGNPPAEAVAARVPYVSSLYELYDAVYGECNLQALLLPVQYEPSDKDLWSFAEAVLDLMFDEPRRRSWIEHNFYMAKGLFSIEFLEAELRQLFPQALKMSFLNRNSLTSVVSN